MRRTAYMLASVDWLAIEAAAPAQLATRASTAAAAEDARAEVTAKIVVTSFHIDRTIFTVLTATGASTLEQRAAVNVGNVLNAMLAFPRTSAPEAGGSCNRGLNSADRRGLVPLRTQIHPDKVRLPGCTFPGQAISSVSDFNPKPAASISQAKGASDISGKYPRYV